MVANVMVSVAQRGRFALAATAAIEQLIEVEQLQSLPRALEQRVAVGQLIDQRLIDVGHTPDQACVRPQQATRADPAASIQRVAAPRPRCQLRIRSRGADR